MFYYTVVLQVAITKLRDRISISVVHQSFASLNLMEDALQHPYNVNNRISLAKY